MSGTLYLVATPIGNLGDFYAPGGGDPGGGGLYRRRGYPGVREAAEPFRHQKASGKLS